MKPSRRFSQLLQWSAIAVVVAAVIATGILTNTTLRPVEKNLPITLITEIEALDLLIQDLAEVDSVAEATRSAPGTDNAHQLRHKIKIVFDGVAKLRNTYAFTQKTLNEQRIRMEHFLLSVNLLFLLTLAITLIMIFLIARAKGLQRREIEAQTERRRAEKMLQETDELYSKLIAAIPDIVVRTDVNGQVLFLNDVALQVSDYQRAEVLGKNLLEFIAPEDQKSAIENFTLMFDRRLGPREYALVMKDGKKIPFEINSDVLRRNDGSVYGTVNICRDISKRLQAEEALRESEKQYRLLVENANDAIFIAQDGKIKFPNPRALEILGFTKELPEEIPFDDFIHPEDREIFVDKHRRRLSGEDHLPANYSFRIINKAGREYSVQLNAVTIAWEGRPATLNFVRDITDQLNLEAILRQAQKMEAVGTLAGGVAHDFNNLLMGIQGRISLMMFGMEASHPFFENLNRIGECVKNATDLTRQLLGFARGGKYEIKPTCMNEVLEQSIEMFGRTRKEIQIHKQYEEPLWTVEVDQGQMHQVLLNLFVNAWQAMPGGGDLHLRTENCVIHEGMLQPPELSPGNYIKISVTDSGAGMDEATKARIFEPFFTTKEMGRGTGLGLASSYGIIRNHGGWIGVDSTIGQGSTFSFYLPASEKTVTLQSPAPAKELKGMESILLVDDEAVIIDIGKEFLEVLGYNVFTARSGQEALETYSRKSGKIDLVIMDMIMPTMDGGETIQRLKAINPQARVILSSGYSIDGQATEIMNRGCNGFIQKPYGIDELSEAIRKALG
jgi:two-component system, cell cycle sensor histidine kinase and response regulator CckA